MPNPRGSNTTLSGVPADLTGIADGQGMVWNAADGRFVPGGGAGDSYTAVKNAAVLDGSALDGFVVSPQLAPVGTSLELVGGLVKAAVPGVFDVVALAEYTGGGTNRDVALFVTGPAGTAYDLFGGAGKQTAFNGLYAQTVVMGVHAVAGDAFGAYGYAGNDAAGDATANYRVTLRVVRRA